MRPVRMPRAAALVAAAFLGALGCGNGDAEPHGAAEQSTPAAPRIVEPDDFVSLSLERTPCFGFCPSYIVTVHADGRVEYLGRAFVDVTGEGEAQVDAQAVDRLIAKLNEVEFLSLDKEYRGLEQPDGTVITVTDLPTRITTLRTRSSGTHRVENYFGGPAGLEALEDLIDELAGTERWVGDPGPPDDPSDADSGD